MANRMRSNIALAALFTGLVGAAVITIAIFYEAGPLHPVTVLGAALAVLVAAIGLVGVLGALKSQAASPLFGRNAPKGQGRPRRLLPYLLAVPAIAVLALVGEAYLGRKPAEPPLIEAEDGAEAGEDAPPPGEIAQNPEPDDAGPPPQEDNPPQDGGQDDVVEAPPPRPADPPVTVAPPPQTEEAPPQVAGRHEDTVIWLSVSPDRKSLLSAASDRKVKLWRLDGDDPPRDLGEHRAIARAAMFMPDGIHALTAGDDGEIVQRVISDGSVARIFSGGEHGDVSALAMSPDGRIAAGSYKSGKLIVWNIENGAPIHVLAGNGWAINGIAISRDGKLLAGGSIDGELRLWSLSDGRLLRIWKGHERGTYGAAFTEDGRLVTGSGDFTIKVWEPAEGREIRRFEGHSGTVYAIDLSPDGKRVASAALDGTARVWDMATGRETAAFHDHVGRVYAVAFRDDQTVISAGDDRAIRVWSADSGRATGMVGPER